MKKIFSWVALALLSATLFTACSDDDDDNDVPVTDAIEVTSGVYVVNEGSYYYGINGSVTSYDPTSGTAQQSVFQEVNGRALGGTPNDAVISGDYIYIATTDENRVEIANASTMASVAYVSVTQPRELAASTDASKVFVSSYNGKVYAISTTSYELVDSSAVVGSYLEGIGVYGDYVYVCNSYNADYTYNTNVVKLDAILNKVKDITVAANPTQIEVVGDNVFVVSTGNYYDVSAVAQQINPATDAVSEIAPATMIAASSTRLFLVNAPWGSTPTYSYADVNGTTIGSVQTWIDGADLVSTYAMAYDYVSGWVYVTSSSEDPDYGGASYTLPGYAVVYTADGEKQSQFDTGLNPGTVVFLHE